MRGERPSPLRCADMPPAVVELMEQCWQTDPLQRPSLAAIVSVLERCHDAAAAADGFVTPPAALPRPTIMLGAGAGGEEGGSSPLQTEAALRGSAPPPPLRSHSPAVMSPSTTGTRRGLGSRADIQLAYVPLVCFLSASFSFIRVLFSLCESLMCHVVLSGVNSNSTVAQTPQPASRLKQYQRTVNVQHRHPLHLHHNPR